MSYVAYIVILLNILILNTILNTTKGKISYNICRFTFRYIWNWLFILCFNALYFLLGVIINNN